MPLNKASLKTGIEALLNNTAANAGTYADFAAGLADLIDAYVKTGTVSVPAGIAVATTGTAAAQTGVTTSVGTGTIS